jgi:hypothetical protein
VFSPSDDTRSIYNRVGQAMVRSVARGYNGTYYFVECSLPLRRLFVAAGTIFAYGQTAAGKTHTMQGSAAAPGIVRMAMEDIMEHIAQVSRGR